MEFFIAGLLAVSLAATALSAQFLARETRRQFEAARKLAANTRGAVMDIKTALAELRRDLAGMEDQRGADAAASLAEEAKTAEALQALWRSLEVLPGLKAGMNALLERETDSKGALEAENRMTEILRAMAERLNELPSRQDAALALKRLEALLEDSPALSSRDAEGAMSRAVEEGISSILSYAAGKVPGVELRL